MTIAIAFIRGINVGGKNMLPMAELRTLCEDMGLKDVRTYIQSGNVVFTCGAVGPVAKKLEGAIEKARGFRPSVVVRTLDEVKEAVDKSPLANIRNPDESRLLIMFLSGDPKATAAKAIEALDGARERVVLRGRETFLYLPDGIADAKLPMAKVERALGVPSTSRNVKTLAKVIEIAQQKS